MSQGKRESKAQADPLEAFSEALRERVASREALLAEGKAMTARRRKAGKAAKASLLSLLLAGSLWWLDPAWHTEQVRVAVARSASWCWRTAARCCWIRVAACRLNGTCAAGS